MKSWLILLHGFISPFVTNLTAAGPTATVFHRHELIYDPVSAQGTYLFDGMSTRTWPGEVLTTQNGQACWGPR